MKHQKHQKRGTDTTESKAMNMENNIDKTELNKMKKRKYFTNSRQKMKEYDRQKSSKIGITDIAEKGNKTNATEVC